MMHKSDLTQFVVGTLLGGLMVFTWILGIFFAPVDAYQGDVYRIIYLHVPAAFAAFSSAFILFLASVYSLRKKETSWALASVEVGLLFTALTLITGAIWGKPTWGTWWTWDARLTTTFLLFILFVAYLLLYHSLTDVNGRRKACAVLGILIFVDVPIIYKSVQWWRTLHQTQTIIRPGGSSMSGSMLWILLVCLFVMVLFSIWIIALRASNLKLKAEIEESMMQKFDERGARGTLH